MTTCRKVDVAGVEVFYREAGPAKGKHILLLHGFPTSSHYFRHLIPILAAQGYHVVAPDLPGFGFTEVPDDLDLDFERMAEIILQFTAVIELDKYAIYVNDYGAPTGFRMALSKPQAITAIISQNGNAFEEGLGEDWETFGIKALWKTGGEAERKKMEAMYALDSIMYQYTTGESQADRLQPEAWAMDHYTVNATPLRQKRQVDLFYDYRNNVALYPKFHEYFKTYQPPTLAIWGKNDPIFIWPGAEAFKTVLPDVEVVPIDGGHFALELHLDEIAAHIIRFLSKL